ncbi:hypothetical protein FRC10_007558 [Ceratobasidium sp. 414]|nr:hypothetical protein FRC10_007558 [Ceratobasidium sp. 414]
MATLQTEEVWLTDLKVASLRLSENPIGNTLPPAQPQVSVGHPSSFRSKPYERLAADKPGEELAPDAGIWQLYVEEANEHDNELVKEKNNNLDMMLLFAGLFSAVLTAFIIESKNLLQQDSGDLTATLLLAIAQSQHRIERGTPQMAPDIELPAFSASLAARWINGLWFTALALSLSAALLALLAKEWLIAFTASRSRSARTYAHLHQTRLRGMDNFGALHIIGLLPSMLHLSLLLFSLGFAVYLWTLDAAIAVMGVVVSGVTVAFYVVTAVLGAVYHQYCPFTTQISKYLRIALQIVWFGDRASAGQPSSKSDDQTEGTPHIDLQALSWLIDNARDPAVSDCACQALAGLRVRALSPPSPEPNLVATTTSVHTDIPPQGTLVSSIARIWGVIPWLKVLGAAPSGASNYHELMHKLFDQVCLRLSEAKSRQDRDLKASQGHNVARYSAALPALVHYLETYAGDKNKGDARGEYMATNKSEAFAQPAFRALDSVWDDDCPEFSADSYALLTAADIRLARVVAQACHFGLDSPSAHRFQCQDPDPHTSDKPSISQESQAVINMESVGNPALHAATLLLELQARYSRVCARAAFFLGLHNDGMAPINKHPLAYLLESLHLAAQCAPLNTALYMNMGQLQLQEEYVLPEFNASLVGSGVRLYLHPTELGDEYVEEID